MLWKGVLLGRVGFMDYSNDLFLSIYQDCLFHCCSTVKRVTKRRITFADLKGLPLESIHVVAATEPTYTPGRIVPRLHNNNTYWTRTMQMNGKITREEDACRSRLVCIRRTCRFIQPGTLPNFIEKTLSQKVLLEGAIVEQSFIHGKVRVTNMAYDKEVVVRWTRNNWRTFRESSCSYCPGLYNGGQTDRFSFLLPTTVEDNEIEFVIRYKIDGQEYWDNNAGLNYVIK